MYTQVHSFLHKSKQNYVLFWSSYYAIFVLKK